MTTPVQQYECMGVRTMDEIETVEINQSKQQPLPRMEKLHNDFLNVYGVYRIHVIGIKACLISNVGFMKNKNAHFLCDF